MRGTASLLPDQALTTAVKFLGGGLAIGAAYYFIARPLIEKFKNQSDLNKDQANTITPKKGKPLFDLKGKPINGANLSTIAIDLENALSFPVDQDRVIRVFLSTPWGYVGKLEQTYLDKYGVNLRQKLVDKLSDTNWIKIKFYFK